MVGARRRRVRRWTHRGAIKNLSESGELGNERTRRRRVPTLGPEKRKAALRRLPGGIIRNPEGTFRYRFM